MAIETGFPCIPIIGESNRGGGGALIDELAWGGWALILGGTPISHIRVYALIQENTVRNYLPLYSI